MSESIRIRKADRGDVRAVDEINEQVVTYQPLLLKVRNALRGGAVWIAELDGAPVGYAIASVHFFDNAFIDLLIVHRGHRRKGVAQALIAAIEAWSPTDKLFTSTNESNEPMRALLERLGYTYSGTIDNLDEGDPERFYFKQLR
ncbi:hypothetical protein BH09CHL1_BH09CHL1_22660 [soil metagenome]